MVMKVNHSKRKTAIITGASIVLMAVVAGIIMPLVFKPVFDANSEAVEEVVSSVQSNFLIGIIGWMVILITDLIASWGLYKFFKNEINRKAEIMGGLRLLYSVGLAIGIIQLIRANLMISSEIFNTMEVYELVISFQSIWQFSLIIFGVHLLLLSSLVCEKKTFRQVISGLLFFAGIGYLISNTSDIIITNYDVLYRDNVEVVFILPMVLGEVMLAFWLMFKGGKQKNTIGQEKLAVF